MSPDFWALPDDYVLLYGPPRIRLRIPTLLLPPCARLPPATVLSCFLLLTLLPCCTPALALLLRRGKVYRLGKS